MGEDAYAYFGNGSFIPCCDSAEQCHADWNGNTRCYVQCVDVGTCPPVNPDYPLETEEPPPPICTGIDQDPYEVYGNGTLVPCCNPSDQCLADWNSNGRFYYRCLEKDSCPTIPTSPGTDAPVEPPVVPDQCTGNQNDPYEINGDGTFIPCCNPRFQCLADWNGDKRWYYRCVDSCPAPDPDQPTVDETIPAVPLQCTGINADPYELFGNGTVVPCCIPDSQCLSDWNENERSYYRCVDKGTCPPADPNNPLEAEIPPATCTESDQDPYQVYGNGTFIPCCNPSYQCLKDWDGDGRNYYRCVADCSIGVVIEAPVCTSEDQDPYEEFGNSTERSCCTGLGKCLDDWNNQDRFYFRCLKCCSETCTNSQLPSPTSTRTGVPSAELENYVPKEGEYGVFVSKFSTQGSSGASALGISSIVLFTAALCFL